MARSTLDLRCVDSVDLRLCGQALSRGDRSRKFRRCEVDIALEVGVVRADAESARRVPVGRHFEAIVLAVGIEHDERAIAVGARISGLNAVLDVGIEDGR